MTEPQGGADPREFRCRAVRDGDSWVIDGEKYFSSHADLAEFLIAMVITNPDVPVHQGASMFLVPRETPGLNIVRLAGLGHEPLGHGHHTDVLLAAGATWAFPTLAAPGVLAAILGDDGARTRPSSTSAS